MKKNSESLYFISDRHGSGDHSPSHRRGCCRAATAKCLSCAAGMTQEQYLAQQKQPHNNTRIKWGVASNKQPLNISDKCKSQYMALQQCKMRARGGNDKCKSQYMALQQCKDGNKPQQSPQDSNMRSRKEYDRPELAVNNNDNRSGYIWKNIAIFVVLFLIGGIIGGGIIYLLIQKS